MTRPYLCVAGAPPLRFAEAAPPPDLATRNPAGAPPKPVSAPVNEATPAPASTAIAVSEAHPESLAAPNPAATVAIPNTNPEKDKSSSTLPAPILPDDTRAKVRAEDFLPFFQFPGSATPDTPPAPGRQPPSSATYRQQ